MHQPVPPVLWSPTPEQRSAAAITDFSRAAGDRAGRDLSEYADLWSWSTEDLAGFWGLLADHVDLQWHDRPTEVLPEAFGPGVAEAIRAADVPTLDALHASVEAALTLGRPSVVVGGEAVAPSPALLAAIAGERKARAEAGVATTEDGTAEGGTPSGPVVLVTADNLDAVTWRPDRGGREAAVPLGLPSAVTTVAYQWAR